MAVTASQPERRISVIYGAQLHQPPQIRTAFGPLHWILPHEERRANDALPARKEGQDTFYLYFCVQDTGPGLSPQQIERLFKRFSQASPRTHITYGGSGLGLYICRELAEKQGGEVGVASTPGRGSVFAFYIESQPAQASDDALEKLSRLPNPPEPIMVSDRPGLPSIKSFDTGDKSVDDMSHSTAPQTPKSSARPSQTPLPSSQAPETGYRILLVEDNLLNQRILAKQLRTAKCTVTVANHGVEALELLEKADCWHSSGSTSSPGADKARRQVNGDASMHFDVILMDWEMPVMNGLVCTKRIRQLERDGQLTQRLPVIATTANVRQEQMDQAMDAGMDSVMPKPFTVQELLAKIQSMLAPG